MLTDSRPLTSPPLSEWLFPGIFMLIGAVVLLFGLQNLQQAHSSNAWPTTNGVITSTGIGRSTNRKGTTYRAQVAYDYSVFRVLYSSDQVRFGDYAVASPGHARSIVNRYPVGKKVTVFYSRADPAVAMLEPGMSLAGWFMPVGGAIFLCAGYFLGPSRRSNRDSARCSSEETT